MCIGCCSPQKQATRRRIFFFPLTVALDSQAAAERLSSREGTAGIIPQVWEQRAEAKGQGRSAPGRNDVELLLGQTEVCFWVPQAILLET